MTQYVIIPPTGRRCTTLISASNHYGGMGGHYTAYRQEQTDGNYWYFDDQQRLRPMRRPQLPRLPMCSFTRGGPASHWMPQASDQQQLVQQSLPSFQCGGWGCYQPYEWWSNRSNGVGVGTVMRKWRLTRTARQKYLSDKCEKVTLNRAPLTGQPATLDCQFRPGGVLVNFQLVESLGP